MRVPEEFRYLSIRLALVGGGLLAAPKFLIQLVFAHSMSEVLVRDWADGTMLGLDCVILGHLALAYIVWRKAPILCLSFGVALAFAQVGIFYQFRRADLPLFLGLVAGTAAALSNVVVLYMAHRVASWRARSPAA